MSQLASDGFVRADNPSIGSPWVVAPSQLSGFQIVSDTAQPGVLSDDELDYYGGISWPNDQYAEVTYSAVGNTSSNHGMGPAVRVSTTDQTYYRAVGSAAGYELFRMVAGTPAQLSTGTGTTFAPGDRLTLQFIGTAWTLFKNGTSFASGTDSSIASGYAGMGYSGTETVAGVSLWAAGSVSAAALAGNVAAATAATGQLTNWATVTLAVPLYTGVGGILDPNFWFDSRPVAGSVVYYDPTHLTIQTNGEINANSNNCQGPVQFFDGTSWAYGLVVFTPTLAGYANAATIATGTLLPRVPLSGGAVAATVATGYLNGAIHLVGGAAAATVATGTLLGSIIALRGDAFALAAAAGTLTPGTGQLIPVLDVTQTFISQYANSPTLLQLAQSGADAILN